MKPAGFYLDAWLLAKALNRPLSAIHKISVAEGYVVTERDEEEVPQPRGNKEEHLCQTQT